MNFKIDLMAAVRLGAASKRGAMSLSADDIQAVANYAATCDAMLTDILEVARAAHAQRFAIMPESLLTYLDQNFKPEDSSHGQANQQTENQGCEPAGAAEHGAGG